METADNVTRKYEDCWDGTKQPTIYVWNINKIFCVGFGNTRTHIKNTPLQKSCSGQDFPASLCVCVCITVAFD